MGIYFKNYLLICFVFCITLKLNAISDSTKTKRPYEIFVSKGFGYHFVVGDGYIEPPGNLMGSSISSIAHFKQNFSYGNFFVSVKKNLLKSFNIQIGLGYSNRRSRLLANIKTREVINRIWYYDIGPVPFYRDYNNYNAEFLMLLNNNIKKKFYVSYGVKIGLPSGYVSNNKSNADEITLQSFFLSPKISELTLYNNRSREYYFIPNLIIGKYFLIKNEMVSTDFFYEYKNGVGFSISYFIN